MSTCTIKWAIVGLHTVMLIFSLFATLVLTAGDIKTAYILSETNAALNHALWLGNLLIGGNGLGIMLLLTPLFRSFIGNCVLVMYELVFLSLSLVYLAPEYSVMIGIVVCILLYVTKHRLATRKVDSP